MEPFIKALFLRVSAFAYTDLAAILETDSLTEENSLAHFRWSTDPHNLALFYGQLMRPMSQGVIIQASSGWGDPSGVKTSTGAVEHIPIARVTNLAKPSDAG